MSGDAFGRLAEAEEIRIAFHRPDGSTGSTPVWIVAVGDDLFVRSMRGPRGGWYRRLRADPDGEVLEGDHRHEVRAEPVSDPATIAAVTSAYARKYSGSPYVDAFLSEEIAAATLRLATR